jgi:hypothetical protein
MFLKEVIVKQLFLTVSIVLFFCGECNFSQALVPHRAHYKVTLLFAATDSEVVDVEGTMELKMADVCDGWTIEQKSYTTLALKLMPQEVMSAHYVAWESKAGDKLRFYINRVYNGIISEDIKGEANFAMKEGKSQVNFYKPEALSISILPGTIPPIKHLMRLLSAAQSGQEVVNSEVFDGSSVSNPVHIDTFITKKKPSCSKIEGKNLRGPVYPMQLAVYSLEDKDALPRLEIHQNFYTNGVMCSYTINFGDYKIKGILEQIEYLPQTSCQSRLSGL